ncbi:MAG: NTP transferase domain-containing protein [Thermoproteota archaeon]
MTTTVAAVIMCGGRGSRMGKGEGRIEKPMIEIAGRRFVERVYLALAKSGRFSRIAAAVSPNTPRTREFLLSTGRVEVIDTPGVGYPQDLSLVLSRLAPEKVLVVPADLPLLTPQAVEKAVDALEGDLERTPAASIVFEIEFAEKLGVKPSVTVDGGGYCHSGITLFDAGAVCNSAVDESYVAMNMVELAVNVNTKDEKEVARRLLLIQNAQDLARDEGL